MRSHLALSVRIRVLEATRVTKGDDLYALIDAVANRTRNILHLTLSLFVKNFILSRFFFLLHRTTTPRFVYPFLS